MALQPKSYTWKCLDCGREEEGRIDEMLMINKTCTHCWGVMVIYTKPLEKKIPKKTPEKR